MTRDDGSGALRDVPGAGGEESVSAPEAGNVNEAKRIAEGLRRGTLRFEPTFIQDPVKGWRLVEVSIVRNE